MVKGRLVYIFSFFLLTQISWGQESVATEIRVSGRVSDFNDNPIKAVVVFVDSVSTNVKTNKKGLFDISVDSNAVIVSVYSKKYGLLSLAYTGEENISFQFPENNKTLSKKDLSAMGFDIKTKSGREAVNYADFASVYDIFKAKFPNVRVVGSRLIVSKGINTFSGNTDPLVLVNGVQNTNVNAVPTSEIKSIQVISRGSETASYGFRGVGGVILIELKK